MLLEAIGAPAMLEQTAEEAAELAQACLKYARYLRGENAPHKDVLSIRDNLHEEVADLEICLRELENGGILNESDVRKYDSYKRIRMARRLSEAGK